MLAMLLEALGHDALVEHLPDQALKRARAAASDACVPDIGLPGIDSNELAGRLQVQPATEDAMLIAVTGYGQEQD
jgi:CheY-like chemotaxis protein